MLQWGWRTAQWYFHPVLIEPNGFSPLRICSWFVNYLRVHLLGSGSPSAVLHHHNIKQHIQSACTIIFVMAWHSLVTVPGNELTGQCCGHLVTHPPSVCPVQFNNGGQWVAVNFIQCDVSLLQLHTYSKLSNPLMGGGVVNDGRNLKRTKD